MVLIDSTLLALPVAHEGMPDRLLEAIARRRVATITGKCPWGGEIEVDGPRVLGKVNRATVWHKPPCLVQDEAFEQLLDEWATS